jgi:hypothetical protein
MIDPMFRRVPVQFVALAAFFILCQVIGTMCALPDLSEAREAAILMEDNMAYPMDGTIMCPPSLTSSPERQVKHIPITDAGHVPVLQRSAPGVMSGHLSPPPWSRSSAFSIVPISIGSSSVLRI